MSFIATANPPVTGAEAIVTGDGWWPDFNPVEVRNACLLDGTVTPDRLRKALVEAFASVTDELGVWRVARESEGVASLSDVPGRMIDGEKISLHRFRRAVHECLMADLQEGYRGIDTTPQAVGKTERVTEGVAAKIEEHRRKMRWAISDLLGINRSTVDLI